MRTLSSARVIVSPSWKRPPIAQPAAAPAPTSSVPTRMATLIKVVALVQLIGVASAKRSLLKNVHEALADIPRRLAAQVGGRRRPGRSHFKRGSVAGRGRLDPRRLA